MNRAKTRAAREGGRSSPARRLLAQEAREQIQNAIEVLPEHQRLVLSLRDVEGCFTEEVCNALGFQETNDDPPDELGEHVGQTLAGARVDRSGNAHLQDVVVPVTRRVAALPEDLAVRSSENAGNVQSVAGRECLSPRRDNGHSIVPRSGRRRASRDERDQAERPTRPAGHRASLVEYHDGPDPDRTSRRGSAKTQRATSTVRGHPSCLPVVSRRWQRGAQAPRPSWPRRLHIDRPERRATWGPPSGDPPTRLACLLTGPSSARRRESRKSVVWGESRARLGGGL